MEDTGGSGNGDYYVKFQLNNKKMNIKEIVTRYGDGSWGNNASYTNMWILEIHVKFKTNCKVPKILEIQQGGRDRRNQ